VACAETIGIALEYSCWHYQKITHVNPDFTKKFAIRKRPVQYLAALSPLYRGFIAVS
jgi:hypothetical protein